MNKKLNKRARKIEKIRLAIILMALAIITIIGIIEYKNVGNVKIMADDKTLTTENTNLKEQTIWNSETEGLGLEVTDDGVTTNKITVKVVKAEMEAVSEQDLEYKYYIKESNKVDYPKTASYTGAQKIYTYSNLVAGKNYDVKVVLTNTNTKKEIASELKVINTKQVPDTKEEITASQPTWNNEKASITLNTTTGLKIEYQVNTATEGGWTEGKTVDNLKNGDIVRIRLSDGINKGNIGSITIGKVVQEVSITKESATINSITVKVTSNNKEYREETRPEYSYYIKESTETNYPTTPTYTGTDSYTFSNLKVAVKYDIKVVLTNKAGNQIQGELKESSIIQGDIATIVTVTKGTVTINSIQVNVTSKNEEIGMPANPRYKYYIKKSANSDYPIEADYIGVETSHTFTDLEQNESYDIKVTTQDNAGNIGEGKLEGITTEKITNGLETGEITVGEIIWKDGNATLTLETTTDLDIQYKVGENGEWTTGTEVTELKYRDIVYVRLTDGKNYGDEGSIIIQDEIAPKIIITEGKIETNSIQISVTSQDNESGMPENPIYNYYIKKTADSDYPIEADHIGIETSHTFTDLEPNVSYDIKVTTQDNAGNTKEVELKYITTIRVIGGLETGDITVKEVIWNDGKATLILETTTDLNIQYKVGEDGEWTTGTIVTDLENEDVVYVRLTDGRNYGSEASVKILDKIEPTVTIIKGTVTTNSIQITVNATDAQSGMPSSPTYEYYIAEEGFLSMLDNSLQQTTYTFTGLSPNTSYNIEVRTQDVAGNYGSKTETIKTLDDIIYFSINGESFSAHRGDTWNDVYILSVTSSNDMSGRINTFYSSTSDRPASWIQWDGTDLYTSSGTVVYATDEIISGHTYSTQ